MNLVQSYWSLPSKSKYNNNFSRINGGWPDTRFHAMSWAYSNLTLKKHHPTFTTTLHTDAEGYKWLVDELNLSYDRTIVDLDVLNDYSPQLWALGKINTYGQQKEPFLHIDSDIYVGGSFSSEIINSNLIVQNLEVSHPFYEEAILQCKDFSLTMPDFDKDELFTAVNAGVLGGHDLKFIKKYCETAFKFVNENLDFINKMEFAGKLNLIIEQFFFYQLAKVESINFDRLHCVLPNNMGYLSNLTRWGPYPQSVQYIHMLGEAKQTPELLLQLESRFAYEFPDKYRYINSLYKTHNNKKLKTGDDYIDFSISTEILKQLGYSAGQYSEEEIESILEDNFSDPRYHKLWDIYQIESFAINTRQIESTVNLIDIDCLYKRSPDEFLKLKFRINPSVCRILYLYNADWTVIDKKLQNLEYEHKLDTGTMRKYLISELFTMYKIFEVQNWFEIFLILEDDVLSGDEIIERIVKKGNYLYDHKTLRADIYEFLTTQCFTYNRLKFEKL